MIVNTFTAVRHSIVYRSPIIWFNLRRMLTRYLYHFSTIFIEISKCKIKSLHFLKSHRSVSSNIIVDENCHRSERVQNYKKIYGRIKKQNNVSCPFAFYIIKTLYSKKKKKLKYRFRFKVGRLSERCEKKETITHVFKSVTCVTRTPLTICFSRLLTVYVYLLCINHSNARLVPGTAAKYYRNVKNNCQVVVVVVVV